MTDEDLEQLHELRIPPFLKWAGGKRWLVNTVTELVPNISSMSGTYVEPFLGSAAMFFALQPKKAILNDLNRDLIEVYRAIKLQPADVRRSLASLDGKHSKRFYYEMRDRRTRNRLTSAVKFLYLNRTCWNGLYRVNLKGTFNVPIGTKNAVVLPTDDFNAASTLLQSATLSSLDFEKVFAKVRRADVVFADPPYTVNHNLNGFLKYNEKLFAWEDQERLHNCAVSAAATGAKVIVTNADHKSIRTLYKERVFTVRTVGRFSKISGDNGGRKQITEVLITANI